jgi:hypothetical protein
MFARETSAESETSFDKAPLGIIYCTRLKMEGV